MIFSIVISVYQRVIMMKLWFICYKKSPEPGSLAACGDPLSQEMASSCTSPIVDMTPLLRRVTNGWLPETVEIDFGNWFRWHICRLFAYWKWWLSIAMLYKLPEGMSQSRWLSTAVDEFNLFTLDRLRGHILNSGTAHASNQFFE